MVSARGVDDRIRCTTFGRWFVTLNSELGGGARKDFIVFAYCCLGR